MAAISQKNNICLSFGWLGSHTRTVNEIPESVKVIYIYDLYKQPICVEIPNLHDSDLKLKPLPFTCGYKTEVMPCTTETLSIEKEQLDELYIKAHICTSSPSFALTRSGRLETTQTTKNQDVIRSVSLKYNIKKIENGKHYRLAVNAELKAFLLIENQTAAAVSIVKLFDTMEAANGIVFYLSLILSVRLKRAAHYFWSELMLEPRATSVNHNFADGALIDQAIREAITHSLNAKQLITMYNECQPQFVKWDKKSIAQKEHSARITLKTFFDSMGTTWLTDIVRAHLKLLVNNVLDFPVPVIIEAMAKQFVQESIRHTYSNLLLQV